MQDLSPRLIKRIKQIKLVASDLDGTLLDDEGKLSKATHDAVWKLKGLGMNFAIMTARAHSSAERIADQLDLQMPIISLDGGLVRLPHNKENIFASYIKPQVVRTAIEESEKRFANISIFADDKMVCRESERIVPGYIDNFELDTVEVDDLNSVADRTIQLIIYADAKQTITSIARKVGGFFQRIDIKIYKSSHHDDLWYLEIKNKSHSKATGLAHLEKFLNINKSEVAVLGDFQNDIQAFEHAGIGVAMKNAVWELKERADYITEASNGEDGAAEFLELIYKLRVNHQDRHK